MEDKDRTLSKTREEIKKTQTLAVKISVEKTFAALEELEQGKANIQEKIKVLKHDLYDLKDGRLDRVAERQLINADPSLSVFKVKKVDDQLSTISPWYIEYHIKVVKQGNEGQESELISCSINNSIVKLHAAGTYKLPNGNIRYL